MISAAFLQMRVLLVFEFIALLMTGLDDLKGSSTDGFNLTEKLSDFSR